MDEILHGFVSNAGLAGCVLAWHLLVILPRISSIEGAINRMLLAKLAELISESKNDNVKEALQDIEKDTKTAEEKRRKRVI